MKKFQKIASFKDSNIAVNSPLSQDVISERAKEYHDLSNIEFKKKYRNYVFTPSLLVIGDEHYEINLNFCNNTFCKWYSLPQKKFEEVKNKPSRYKLQQTSREIESEAEPRIMCNPVPGELSYRQSIENSSNTISNWSVAEEIKRLITINSLVPIEPVYSFHKEGCLCNDKTPFNNKEFFHKRGKSSTNSQKYQCKGCKKITNVLPGQEQSFNYHQQRNDILIQFTKDILSRTPVKRTCEKFNIGSATYYNKLEWLYRKCLEFNNRYETQPLKQLSFNEIWINTDMMVYNLNNIRHKGKAKKSNDGVKEKKLQTYLVSSADLHSGYVFRADIAYDYEVSLEDVEQDTLKYHCDHSYSFLRKNERLKYPYCPQSPTKLDNQTILEYENELLEFNQRKNYVEGCHVKSQYTAMAHYFLLNRDIHAKNWYFVSDDDSVIQSCIFKIFSEKFSDGYAMYFTCQYEKNLTLAEAGTESFKSRNELKRWANGYGIKSQSIYELAQKKIEMDLQYHKFYDTKTINGVVCFVRGNNPINHPLPAKDEGIRYVNLINYVSYISDSDLAKLIVQVNSRAINNFFQEVRRRISILERPIVTARGDGKSYIYSNYNPKYAQQIVTIFRTFYNFCSPKKINGRILTPAQYLGLTDKVFEIKDIVYFR